MRLAKTDIQRGERLHRAMTARGRRKLMALAAELGVSPAAISKWRQGGPMSVEHACGLAASLEVSLDWLLMGRNPSDAENERSLEAGELELIMLLRERPAHIGPLLIDLVSAIPKRPDPISKKITAGKTKA